MLQDGSLRANIPLTTAARTEIACEPLQFNSYNDMSYLYTLSTCETLWSCANFTIEVAFPESSTAAISPFDEPNSVLAQFNTQFIGA